MKYFVLCGLFSALLMSSVSTMSQPNESRLSIDENAIMKLTAMRKEEKFLGNSVMTNAEKRQMAPVIDELLDKLISGSAQHPQESWIAEQAKAAAARFYLEDTEVREPCVMYIIRIYKILGIGGSHGTFREYMIEF